MLQCNIIFRIVLQCHAMSCHALHRDVMLCALLHFLCCVVLCCATIYYVVYVLSSTVRNENGKKDDDKDEINPISHPRSNITGTQQ